MNTIQIDKVSFKHVKSFQGVYPIDLSPSTLIKSSIIFINLDKYFMLGSYWVLTLGMLNILIRRFATLQVRNHGILATLLNLLDIQPPQNTGTHVECLRPLLLHLRPPHSNMIIDDVIREHVCTSLHL